MNDKQYFEDMLTTAKAASGLFLHGTIEAATPEIRNAFKQALDQSLEMQNAIAKTMEAKGWYTAQQVDQNKIQQASQKFSNQQMQ